MVYLGVGSFDEEAEDVVEGVGEDGGAEGDVGLADHAPGLHGEGDALRAAL